MECNTLQSPLLKEERGILIELSFISECMTEKEIDEELIEAIKTRYEQIGETVVLGDKYGKADYDNFPNENNQATVLFLRRLEDLWSLKNEIITCLNKGTNVILKSYTLDMFSHCHANNCFSMMEIRQPLAVNNFTSKVQGLPIPDIILNFTEPIKQLDKAHRAAINCVPIEEAGDPPVKDYHDISPFTDDNDVVYSRLFRKEQSKQEFMRYFDNIRVLDGTKLLMKIDALTFVLAKRVLCCRDPIKFY